MVEHAADELALGRGDGCPESGGAFDYGEPFRVGRGGRGWEAVVEEGADGGVGWGNKADEAACW